MNKIIFAVFILLFGAIAAQPVNAALPAEYGYQIDIPKTSFTPSVIYAGDMVNLGVDILNRGSNSSITNIRAQLSIGDQFKEIKPVDSIDYLAPGETKTLTFQFQAKPGTASGYYTLTLTITYMRDNDSLQQTQLIFLSVSKVEKNLDITINPNVVNPGKPTQVVFTLKNVGNTPVSNISFSWTEKNNLVLPLGSDNKRYVNVLEANEAVDVSYTLAADPNITPGIYSLDISTTFNDVNAKRTLASQVGLIIGGTTEFEVSAETLSTGQLSVSIANIGSNNASAVVAKIPNQQGITISGSSTAILGSLNKGDFTLANFQAQTAFTGQGAAAGMRDFNRASQTTPQAGDSTAGRSLLIEIDYTDTTGQRQSVQKTVQLSTTQSSSTTLTSGRTRQSAGMFSSVSWALLALIAVGAVVFNRFKAGNKNWKKLAMVIAVIAVLFLAVIFLLGSDLLAIIAATAVSVVLLIRFFRKDLIDSVIKQIRRKRKE